MESNESLKKLMSDNCLISWWDGKEAKNWSAFYDMVSESLSLPEYFGRNTDALFDCLSDLSWISAQNILIVIEHFEDLLSDELSGNPELLTDLVLLLSDVIQEQDRNAGFTSYPINPKSIYFCIISSKEAEDILRKHKIPFSII